MSRERILERERRWAVPAAIPALVALPLYLATFVATSKLAPGDTATEQFPKIHDHAGALVALTIVRALVLLGLILPLAYLFRAAAARNPRVQAPLIGFVVLAPVLFAASTVAQGISFNQVASDYVEQEPQIQSRSFADFRRELGSNPESIENVRLYTDSNALDVERRDGGFYTVKYDPSAEQRIESQLDDRDVSVDVDAGGTPGNALAQRLTDDSGAGRIAGQLLIPAVLAMAVALVYTGLQATRTGLLTRGFGTLGMALGATMILIPPYALLAIMAWSFYLGLLYLGRVRGGRPPAWKTAVAMPWPKPGEEGTTPAQDRAIDAEGSEVTAEGGEPAPSTETGAVARKRKRKRRR